MRALITGGLGFVGSHLAEALIAQGAEVYVLDNCSRLGWDHNRTVLAHAGVHAILQGDVANRDDVAAAVRLADVVFHLAAQVAVTSSITDPRKDFETNLLGTVNILEAIRAITDRAFPPIIFASTNKVYGHLRSDWDVEKRQWRAKRTPWANADGSVEEHQPLDFRSPYGCSKGAADQYVLDYSRTFGLRAAVLRKSCIYGPRQFGCEDQGWLAWFAIAAVLGRPITIYGDGHQVRDVLHVRDCVAAYLAASEYLLGSQTGIASGSWLRLNIGGGPANAISLLDGVDLIQRALGQKVQISFSPWRMGDQRAYVSNVRRAKTLLNWQPTVPAQEGIEELVKWVVDNKTLIEEVLRGK